MIPFATISTGNTIADVAILVVIVAAIIAAVLVGLRQFGIQIPPWVIQLLWIVAVAFCVILAIRLLVAMW